MVLSPGRTVSVYHLSKAIIATASWLFYSSGSLYGRGYDDHLPCMDSLLQLPLLFVVRSNAATQFRGTLLLANS